MYLKSLELVGFKSFAKRTKLEFEPGMTAVVGPNGCGKSNILDAIRWILGEQSAKTLRGSKMEDFIFNGTEKRHALGMAEASLTFAECEEALGTDYHELTITRRVTRAGDGQYLINKTPCRLKDVQRIFMDTGIGTASYSIMEQGRMDLILSSRPEDRRAIFEQASGITKFKADRKEATRKLEQTEGNLLRLADVIREVKRQIGSLQRQAGKARRYKALKEELKKLDIFLARERLTEFDSDISAQSARLTSVGDQLEAANADVARLESGNAQLRRALTDTERQVEALVNARANVTSTLERTEDLIRMNGERIEQSRIASERDEKEVQQSQQQITNQSETLERMLSDLNQALEDREVAAAELEQKASKLSQHEEATLSLADSLEAQRSDYVDLETSYSGYQNELTQLESGRRSDIVRLERLSAERVSLEEEAKSYEERRASMSRELSDAEGETAACKAEVDRLAGEHSTIQKSLNDARDSYSALQAEIAARKVQTELTGNGEDHEHGTAAGAALLLDKTNPLDVQEDAVLGSLSALLETDQEHEAALAAVIRSWLDAVVVGNASAALDILRKLRNRDDSSVRLVVAGLTTQPDTEVAPPYAASPLLSHVRCPENARGAVARLLHNVFFVESLDTVPGTIPAGVAYVTRDGAILKGDGIWEFWTHNSPAAGNKQLLAELQRELPELEQRLNDARQRISDLDSQLERSTDSHRAAQTELDQRRHTQAVKQGEIQVVSREAEQARDRFETVTWELSDFEKRDNLHDQRETEIHAEMERIAERREQTKIAIDEKTLMLRAMEQDRSTISSEAIEARLRHSKTEHRVELREEQIMPMRTRLGELEDLVKSRSDGIVSRTGEISRLESAVQEARQQISSLETDVATAASQLEEVRRGRTEKEERLSQSDEELIAKRALGDQLREQKTEMDIKHAETKMQRQNLLDRVTMEHRVGNDDILNSSEPEWDDEKPENEWIETRTAEIRAKLDAMGQVNLIAIEEYSDLQERHTFLNEQHEDLVGARQKLVAMINKINQTTSQMFSDTFTKVNENFGTMFKRLFNGGSARLVLVDEEDVLESGIEIIARPPGKKLQNVSLLSGGERALTAVSLLFAIYMIKPSPFCILDELDAPLDDSNIGRFISILKDFLDQSQFLVITHSQQTIAAASVIYGITMEEKGVSRLVSMKFVDAKEQSDRAAEEQPTALAT